MLNFLKLISEKLYLINKCSKCHRILSSRLKFISPQLFHLFQYMSTFLYKPSTSDDEAELWRECITYHFARNKTIFYSKVLLQLTEFLLVRWLVKTLIGYREVDNRTFSHFYVDIQLTQNDYLSRYVAEP